MAEKMSFGHRLKHAWNTFLNKDPTPEYKYTGTSSFGRNDKVRLNFGNEKSIVAPLYNRLAIDISSIIMKHVRNDNNSNYVETISSGLNECLTVEANIDQSGRALLFDIAISLFDEGIVAVVPVDTTSIPINSNAYDVLSLRVGKIIEWFPEHVRVRLYNEKVGEKEDVLLPKKMVAIIENPLYLVMNDKASMLKRLIEKLNQLNVIDGNAISNKLNLIIQLPYALKSDLQKEKAENRIAAIENQLENSPHGIAYVDATEKITQLNREINNDLMKQIEYLTDMVYSQLGISIEIMEGKADEKQMRAYYNRTVEPILNAIRDEFKRKWLSKTARSQGQSVEYFIDPFKLVPVSELAEIVDKFSRNEVLTPNEFRAIVGYQPSEEPSANELRNKNMPQQDTSMNNGQENNANVPQNIVDFTNYANQYVNGG